MSKIISINNILFGYEEGKDIFTNFSLNIPKGVTSFLGQNGTGKSTLMLLAAGRIIPEKGDIFLLDKNTKNITNEEELNSIASVIYQNMEFDTDETIGNLLDIVYKSGHHSKKSDKILINEIIEAMDLKSSLNKKTNSASKGEMQRVIIAFSLLFGSPIILMDEPVFAMENNKKDKVFSYIIKYAHEHNINIIYSIHDIDISKKFSDNVVLFFKNGETMIGPTQEILNKENLEQAYQVPMHLLYEREKLNSETLLKRDIPKDTLTGKVIE